jgi:hypothetical protein
VILEFNVERSTHISKVKEYAENSTPKNPTPYMMLSAITKL